MILGFKLSKQAEAQILASAKQKKQSKQEYLRTLIEALHESDSCYLILKPMPHIAKMQAIGIAIDSILNKHDVVPCEDNSKEFMLVPKTMSDGKPLIELTDRETVAGQPPEQRTERISLVKE
jgi:hypothetical protein